MGLKHCYTKATGDSLDSQMLLQRPRQAPPVGRALRILLGLALMVYVAPVYFKVPARVAVGSLLLMLALIGVYSLIHSVVSCRRFGVTDLWPRKGSARSRYLFRCLIGGCRRARRCWL